MTANIKYPIVIYSERYISTHSKERHTSLASYINLGGYVGDSIIDSLGNQFVVKDVILQGEAFAPWHNWFNKDKYVKIRFLNEFKKQLTFNEVLYEIKTLFDRHPKWCSLQAREHLSQLWSEALSVEQLVGMGYAYGRP